MWLYLLQDYNYNNAPRGRSQRDMTLLYKIENMYTLMKNKAHIHHKKPLHETHVPNTEKQT